jgi:hypothetical protein
MRERIRAETRRLRDEYGEEARFAPQGSIDLVRLEREARIMVARHIAEARGGLAAEEARGRIILRLVGQIREQATIIDSFSGRVRELEEVVRDLLDLVDRPKEVPPDESQARFVRARAALSKPSRHAATPEA